MTQRCGLGICLTSDPPLSRAWRADLLEPVVETRSITLKRFSADGREDLGLENTPCLLETKKA
jgi:hypothetical protein